MSIYHENHNKYPLYKNHYTLSGVVYIFKLSLYPIGMKIDIKNGFLPLSAISISVISVFFCINKERKVQETIQDPLKKQEPFKENQEPLKKFPKTF